MRNILILPFTLLSLTTFAQTSKEYTQKGRELIDRHDYMEAILNLNKAVELDAKNASAYFFVLT